jgi:putative tricarboxylic transport membrane protein
MTFTSPYRRKVIFRWVLASLLALCWAHALPADSVVEELTILVPAEPGGGWDLTARAMASALQREQLVDSVTIEYSPGAGGLIGLAQFISSREGQGNVLFVGGLFTVGASIQNHSAVSLLDAVPLARLTFDNAAIAVPTASSFRRADDLFEAMISAPESIAWVGGSIAGVDQINLHEIARSLGITSTRLHYMGLPGGGEVGDALLEGRYQAGISGFSEFEPLLNRGQLRVLAVLTNEDIHRVDVPSFDDLGIKVERLNWRGVFAAPGTNETQVAALLYLVDKMTHSRLWRQLLDEHHWLDAYLPGPEFVGFVESEQVRAADEIKLMAEADPEREKIIRRVMLRRYTWVLALAALSMLLFMAVLYQRRWARKREAGLQHVYETATGKAILHAETLEKALVNIHTHIEEEFDHWNLTVAEKDIALLLLKGLRLKDIADSRGTSERTVRLQAQAIYKKAGLQGRFELAAYFIEDVMQSMELADSATEPSSITSTV